MKALPPHRSITLNELKALHPGVQGILKKTNGVSLYTGPKRNYKDMLSHVNNKWILKYELARWERTGALNHEENKPLHDAYANRETARYVVYAGRNEIFDFKHWKFLETQPAMDQYYLLTPIEESDTTINPRSIKNWFTVV